MNEKKQEIDAQIERIKAMINKNASKEEIKAEQKKLNKMLEEYLFKNKK